MGLIEDIEEAERVARAAMPSLSAMAGTILTSDKGRDDLAAAILARADLQRPGGETLGHFNGLPVTACIKSEDSVVVVMFYRVQMTFLGIPIQYGPLE